MLYKYRDTSKNTLEIFLNKEIYLPISKQFNDPFDAQLLPSDFIKELKSIGYQPNSIDFEKHESYVKDRLLSYGIYSLSRTCDDILMWSHYGASHTGICIGFQERLDHHLVNYEWPIWMDDVVYETDHPFIRVLEDLNTRTRFNSIDLFSNHCELGHALLTAALTVKHLSWKYEKEVRLISEINGLQSIKSSAIGSVVLGMNISNSDEATIRSILSGKEWKHVKIFKAKAERAALALNILEEKS